MIVPGLSLFIHLLIILVGDTYTAIKTLLKI